VSCEFLADDLSRSSVRNFMRLAWRFTFEETSGGENGLSDCTLNLRKKRDIVALFAMDMESIQCATVSLYDSTRTLNILLKKLIFNYL
jgi:hypothetical protein